MTETRTVLLLGNSRPTVAVLRALAGLGYRVIVMREQGGYAAASRHRSEVWDPPNDDGTPEFFEDLARFLNARPDIDIVMPIAETYVLGLAHHIGQLPADRIYATPSPRLVTTCLDKPRMLELCDRLGVPSAPAQTVSTLQELHAAADRIGFPLIVRPVSSAYRLFRRKAFITLDRGTFDARMAEWPDGHPALIVQRFISGPRYNIDYAAQNGKTVQAVATRILRTDIADYTGYDVSGVTEPIPQDLWDFTERINGDLNYTGVGLIQFMVDRDRDEISFLELNPRFNGNTAVPHAAGINLAGLAIDLAEHPDRPVPELISQGGLRHAWLFGDLVGVFRSLGQGMIGKRDVPAGLWSALRDAATADYHLLWSWRDPLPALTQFTKALGRVLPGRRG